LKELGDGTMDPGWIDIPNDWIFLFMTVFIPYRKFQNYNDSFS
jgi:hypothetical protein